MRRSGEDAYVDGVYQYGLECLVHRRPGDYVSDGLLQEVAAARGAE